MLQNKAKSGAVTPLPDPPGHPPKVTPGTGHTPPNGKIGLVPFEGAQTTNGPLYSPSKDSNTAPKHPKVTAGNVPSPAIGALKGSSAGSGSTGRGKVDAADRQAQHAEGLQTAKATSASKQASGAVGNERPQEKGATVEVEEVEEGELEPGEVAAGSESGSDHEQGRGARHPAGPGTAG